MIRPPAERWRRALAIGVAALNFVPVAWMLLAAFKTRADAMATTLLFRPTLDNFRTVLTGHDAEGRPMFATGFGVNLANSVGIAAVSVAVALALGLLAAYGFARLRVRGTERWMFWILAMRMLPPLATIIPLYVLFARTGVAGSYGAIVAVYVAFNLPFAVWMLRSFIAELPRAAEEAAWLDGASRLSILRRVVLPRLGPGIAATAVIALVFTWNDFLFAQMFTSRDTRTVPIAMLRVLGAETGVDWGVFAAAGTIYLAPIFVVAAVLQRHLLRGVTFGTITRVDGP